MARHPMGPHARYHVRDGRMVFVGPLGSWPSTREYLLPPEPPPAAIPAAAAPSTYAPRLPLSHVLLYAAARMWDPEGQPTARLCATLAMVNGYGAPKRPRYR